MDLTNGERVLNSYRVYLHKSLPVAECKCKWAGVAQSKKRGNVGGKLPYANKVKEKGGT